MNSKKGFSKKSVFFLNPRSCGVDKNGGTRYQVDASGRRTKEIDNELLSHIEAFVSGQKPVGAVIVPTAKALRAVLVPRYFDSRWDAPFSKLKSEVGFEEISVGDLIDSGVLSLRGGHGSPSSDQRIGEVPYVKVSDIRNLRINVNPTNLIPLTLAKQRFWRSLEGDSGLRAWDLVTPNRASSNIGEFAVLLPGEERVVLTKEMFVFRVIGGESDGWDPFYLLWAFCLSAVRMQWQRVTLMQTNREDVGDRFREIRLPKPISPEWARNVSKAFRDYFQAVAQSKTTFHAALESDCFKYIASVFQDSPELAAETPTPEITRSGTVEGVATDQETISGVREAPIGIS